MSDRFSDAAIAQRVAADLLTGRYAHVRGLGWLTWDGRRWAETGPALVLEAIRAWTMARTAEAAAAVAAGTGLAQVRKGWIDREHVSRLKAVLTLAEGLVDVPPDSLDARPDVLNCHNGVVYLPTGDLTPHNPDLYLTRLAGCDYNPTALHPDWTAAVSAVPPEIEGWLRVRYGQGITGHMPPDDKVVIQQGGGANGKSTVLTGIASALGDYYQLASDKILMGSQAGAHTTDLADLRGSRFVAIEETPEAGRLDVVRLKKLAGTERITARKMHKDNVSFPASHTLFVNTNYPPVVGETDDGTWRRLLLVCFPYTFTAHPLEPTDRPGDPRLRERLKASPDGQREAVLAWLVEGAVEWYRAERSCGDVPESVARDTAEWRGRTDHVAAFWADHLDPDPDAFVYAGDLIWMFNNYLRQHGNSPVAESTFVRRFASHPLTAGANIAKARIRQEATELIHSRPYGALDPFSRLPGVPQGRIQAWVGLRFRTTVSENPWSEGGGQGGQGQIGPP